jgi:hypothetical protein
MRRWLIVIGAVVALGACLVRQSPSQPVRSRVFTGVIVEGDDGRLTIHAGFTFPIRYVRHVPLQSGDLLQIYVKPLAVSRVDKGFTLTREAAQLHSKHLGPLESVTYEGDVLGGPLVTVAFRRSVRFDVRPGHDFRSLVISVADGATAGTSSPERP